MTWHLWLGIAIGLCVWPLINVILSLVFLWLGPPDDWTAERHRHT
jgi:hypothetical protein